MELTGKAKEQFEEYFYSLKDRYFNSVEMFYKASDSMKWGVYVDFFDSVGVTIIVNTESIDCWWADILSEDIMSPYYRVCVPMEKATRQEARTAAIEKANEIVNNR